MDLSTLNDMQRKAVLKTDGALLLLAGAGSGYHDNFVQKYRLSSNIHK